MKQRKLVTLLGGAVVAWTLTGAFAPGVSRIAVAQSYPTRPINVIVSSPPGAARLDVEARYLPGDAFRKLFDADSMENAAAIKGAGLAASK